ncbi:hypothetical protein GIB67_011525 [Kingdonia uniflora]|uniref:Uncharacterized protein n=1 Tax=Kingdonia uniflora TaxID=39325 RepID=A0A7J7NM90_9MAGN|nr:hypothetical protein GIB67_011525 [Kingdonia uniflora]
MVSSLVNEVSTSGRSVESEMEMSESEEEVGVDQFPNFPRKLTELSEGFLCYLSQLEYGLSLPLINLAKGIMNLIRACPVQMNRNMWEMVSVCKSLNTRCEGDGRRMKISSEDVLQVYGVKNYSVSGGAYLFLSLTRPRFVDLNSAGRPWNDNVIWVKGDCLQRDDEEPMELLFRTVKQTPKSQVTRKESLLDIIAQEDTELEAELEELDISRKKRVNSQAKKVQKSQSTRLMTSTDDSKKKGTDGERRVNLSKAPGVDCTWLHESITGEGCRRLTCCGGRFEKGEGQGQVDNSPRGGRDEQNGCSSDKGNMPRGRGGESLAEDKEGRARKECSSIKN